MIITVSRAGNEKHYNVIQTTTIISIFNVNYIMFFDIIIPILIHPKNNRQYTQTNYSIHLWANYCGKNTNDEKF